MLILEYPKIETLFDRDPSTFKVTESKIRLPEFENIKTWLVTEKIDGTNVRVIYAKGENMVPMVLFGGHTDKAQMPTFLLEYLQKTFTVEKLKQAFPDLPTHGENIFSVTLCGEGYGAKIQKGGGCYRQNSVSFRLFDVRVDQWWLEPENIADIACKLGVKTVPCLGSMTTTQAIEFIKSKPESLVVLEEGTYTARPVRPMEGIVARTQPLMLRRNGERVIWKLKISDFP